jgi:hypothetical protein
MLLPFVFGLLSLAATTQKVEVFGGYQFTQPAFVGQALTHASIAPVRRDTMDDVILVLNSGSSSTKVSVFFGCADQVNYPKSGHGRGPKSWSRFRGFALCSSGSTWRTRRWKRHSTTRPRCLQKARHPSGSDRGRDGIADLRTRRWQP